MFYSENYSEFDRQVQEFKDSLMQSVEQEFKDKMASLERENKRLQYIKDNESQFNTDRAVALRELSFAKQQAKSEARGLRLSELIQDYKGEMYMVELKTRKSPKCDKCNENRRIPYTLPSGKSAHEICECDMPFHEYVPGITMLYNLKLTNTHGFSMWFRLKDARGYDEYAEYAGSEHNPDVFTDQNMGMLNQHRTVFTTKEECQTYCDFLNKKMEDRKNET